MEAETKFGEDEREWLTCMYNQKEMRFVYPPFAGSHQGCYEAINSDPELAPTEGLELALLAHGAYTKDESKWKEVRKDCFNERSYAGHLKVPMRLLWIPANLDLAGVIVERDLAGLGLTTKMNLPEDVLNWTRNEFGLYTSPDKNQTWIPKDRYSLREVNERDGLLIAYLGQEGAEIFVKTAIDNKKIPYSSGIDINKLEAFKNEPKQKVVGIVEFINRLLIGGGNWEDLGFAFGKPKSV